jgi:hypothetical protein
LLLHVRELFCDHISLFCLLELLLVIPCIIIFLWFDSLYRVIVIAFFHQESHVRVMTVNQNRSMLSCIRRGEHIPS